MRKAIAIDFDGCLCSDAYPNVGEPNWSVIEKAKVEQRAGAGLILWTCRKGQHLRDAIAACESWGLTFDTVNETLPEWIKTFGAKSRKVYATEYWDDRAVRMPADGCTLAGESENDAPANEPLTMKELREMDGKPVWIVPFGGAALPQYALVNVEKEWLCSSDGDYSPFSDYGKYVLAYRCKPGGNMPVPADRLKELAEADAHGMVVVSKIPIGTTVYRLHQGCKDEVRIIDGEEYTRKVPSWYITHHKYSWVDAIADAECPELRDKPNHRYYFTLEEARAERDRINAGGDPNARNVR